MFYSLVWPRRNSSDQKNKRRAQCDFPQIAQMTIQLELIKISNIAI